MNGINKGRFYAELALGICGASAGYHVTKGLIKEFTVFSPLGFFGKIGGKTICLIAAAKIGFEVTVGLETGYKNYIKPAIEKVKED